MRVLFWNRFKKVELKVFCVVNEPLHPPKVFRLMKVPSAFYITDCFLYLDLILNKRLFKPQNDKVPPVTRADLAGREGVKGKKMLGGLRFLWRSSKVGGHDPRIADLKQYVQPSPTRTPRVLNDVLCQPLAKEMFCYLPMFLFHQLFNPWFFSTFFEGLTCHLSPICISKDVCNNQGWPIFIVWRCPSSCGTAPWLRFRPCWWRRLLKLFPNVWSQKWFDLKNGS